MSFGYAWLLSGRKPTERTSASARFHNPPSCNWPFDLTRSVRIPYLTLKLAGQLRLYCSEFFIAQHTLAVQFAEFRQQLAGRRMVLARTTAPPSRSEKSHGQQRQNRRKHQQRLRHE
jgi:hypothetical protein